MELINPVFDIGQQTFGICPTALMDHPLLEPEN